MTSSTKISLWVALVLGAGLSGVGRAEEPTPVAPKLSLASSSWLRIDGDSTLHKYHVETRELQVAFQVEPSPAEAATEVEGLVRESAIKGMVLTIPVAGLRSGEDGLDENLRKALNSSQHPTITWRLDSYEVKGPSAPTSALDLLLHGRLTIAGVERGVDLTMRGVREPTGLRLTGQQSLSMRDYGVQPPVLFLGTLKTADQVVISFDLLLELPSNRAGLP